MGESSAALDLCKIYCLCLLQRSFFPGKLLASSNLKKKKKLAGAVNKIFEGGRKPRESQAH